MFSSFTWFEYNKFGRTFKLQTRRIIEFFKKINRRRWDAKIIDINKSLVEGLELCEVTEDEKNNIVSLLNLELEPKEEKI